ncbi:MAG: hypothetical protein ACKVPX_05605 [Myxococcaceae bacterium]
MNRIRATIFMGAIAFVTAGCPVGRTESPIRIVGFQQGSYAQGSELCGATADIYRHSSNVAHFPGLLVDARVENSIERAIGSVNGVDYVQAGRNDFLVEEIFRTYTVTGGSSISLPDETLPVFFYVPEGSDRDNEPSCIRMFTLGPGARQILTTSLGVAQSVEVTIGIELRGRLVSGQYLVSNLTQFPGSVFNTYDLCEDPFVNCTDVVGMETKAELCGELYCN